MTMPLIEVDLCDPSVPVTHYLRARATHDVAIGRRAFHPGTLSRAIATNGTIAAVDQQEMWAISNASTAVPVRQSHRILDQLGTLVVAEARGEWVTHNLLDLLLVVRQRLGWQIVGRVFARSSAAAAPPAPSEDDRQRISDLICSCAGPTPRPSDETHVEDCRYTFAGEPGLEWSIWDPNWRPHLLGGHESRHRLPTIAVEVRGTIAAARLLRTLRPHRIVNHVLLVKDRDGWKIAHVTCAFTPRELLARTATRLHVTRSGER